MPTHAKFRKTHTYMEHVYPTHR